MRHEVEGKVVACTLTQALTLRSEADGGIAEAVIFDMASLLAPLEGCPPRAPEQEACESDWIHFGAEVGLLDPERLRSPALVAERERPFDGEAKVEGCQSERSEPVGAYVAFALMSGLMLRRRLLHHTRR